MKTRYISPSVEVMQVKAYALLVNVSGAGLGDGGQDNGTHIPRAPGHQIPD